MLLLLIEDDVRLARTLSEGLEEEQFLVQICTDGESGLRALRKTPYDVCILDVKLPIRDGFSVVAAARQAGVRTPILMLTALDTLADRVMGLDQGADDYLNKPFAFAEVLARLRALMRRGGSRHGDVLRRGLLSLHLSAHQLRYAEQPLELTPKQFALLDMLWRHAGEVVSRSMLLSSVRGYSYDPGTNVVDVHVAQLRRKLDEVGHGSLIRTVRGVGYVVDEAAHS